MHILVFATEGFVAAHLREAGHEVTVASTPEHALGVRKVAPFDAIVLGGAAPDDVTLAMCSDLRRDGARTPILLFAVGNTTEARVAGLDAGADDCVSASCTANELLARLRALMRRSDHNAAASDRESTACHHDPPDT